jgi:hypothetical protein
LKDVILQERHGGVFVSCIPHAVECSVGDVFEGIIGGSNDLSGSRKLVRELTVS